MNHHGQMFSSFDGTRLHYVVYGEGPPVILLHGFIVDSETNWSNLIEPFVATGKQIITLDARGHGRSEKPHASAAYADRAMAKDVSALIDHLGFDAVDIIGCSLGGFTAIEAALRDDRIQRIALVGVGLEDVSQEENRDCAAGMQEESPSEPTFFRTIADELCADRLALAAWFEGAVCPQVVVDDLHRLKIPVLVVNGEDDLHDEREFVSHIQSGQAITVPGDHFECLDMPELEAAIVSFLTC